MKYNIKPPDGLYKITVSVHVLEKWRHFINR